MPRFVVLAGTPGDTASIRFLGLTPDVQMTGTQVLQSWANQKGLTGQERYFALSVGTADIYDVILPPAPPRPPAQIAVVPPAEAIASLPAFQP